MSEMTVFFVSRHAGAKDWLKDKCIDATIVEHLDLAGVHSGDVVIGTLPAHLAAQICAIGARYVHLALHIPPGDRGRELTPSEMQAFAASLDEYKVDRVGPYSPGPEGKKAMPGEKLYLSLYRRPIAGLLAARRWVSGKPWLMYSAIAILGLGLLSIPSPVGTALGCWVGLGDEHCTGFSLDSLLRVIGFGLVYGLCFVLLTQLIPSFFWHRMRRVTGRDARCRVLIMGLSELKPNELNRLDDILAKFTGRPELYALPKCDFERLPETAPGLAIKNHEIAGFRTAWQQNVRAVHHHRPTLQRVLVLPSEESHQQWESFKRVMTAFFPELPIDLVTISNGEPFRLPDAPGEKLRSYEDYAYVRDGLDRAIEQLSQAHAAGGAKLTEEDICIDVTPGPKLFSIAASIVTLNRALKLSYVSNEGIVTILDAEVGTAESMVRTVTSNWQA